jgi:hypothetical protein
MKVLFVGPSLPGAGAIVGTDVTVRPPATQGDILAAIKEGASVIGLIDGGFEYTASVWHKEILYGLSRGVTIVGAASMGALRAAECHPFGMIGIGKIFEDYRDGVAIDDADVALTHAPAEMDYLPLTVPMVNVRATLSLAVGNGFMTAQEMEALDHAAREIFFKERDWRRILERCKSLNPQRKMDLGRILPAIQVDQKRQDAIMLVERLAVSGSEPIPAQTWTFQTTSFWRENFE